MPKVYKLDTDELIYEGSMDNTELLNALLQSRVNELNNLGIENATFSDFAMPLRSRTTVVFVNCKFNNVDFIAISNDVSVTLIDCIHPRYNQPGKYEMVNVVMSKNPVMPDNETIEKEIGAKVFSLPNKKYVKCEAECDFCHNKFYEIMSRNYTHKMLKEVPQCDKRVCDSCYDHYQLRSKIKGCRTYGYRGHLGYYRTPMDARNTEILGLEMEFEGDFWDWKGLQDAHRGYLHYGYDSSVRGENELSWDCGSYSYWKYLMPLEDVCKAVANGGGSAGDSAGIHIHVSASGTLVPDITKTINYYCRSGVLKTLMEAVSLRDNREKFEQYANLSSSCNEHHAGISYNSHDTCEFRIFNSSLDSRLILRHLKFCKEFYHLVRQKTPKEKILESFSKETKAHIKRCANIQAKKGFITQDSADELIKQLGAM